MNRGQFNYSRPPKTPRRKEKEAEHVPRMPFAEFLVNFKAFCSRKKRRAAGDFHEEEVDVDSEIPEDVAKEIDESLAK